MQYDYISTKSDPLYPISNNQDERILIEFNGIIASEAEYIFYGIQDCPLLEIYPFDTYERLKNYSQDQIYEEIGYFRPRDLLLYLNDDKEIDEDDINYLLEYAYLNYDYSKVTYLAMTEAIKELLSSDFVKSVTFILSNQRVSDTLYLNDIYGEELLSKCSYIDMTKDDNILDVIKDEVREMGATNTPYTTLITNEYQAILDICNNYKEYNADALFYLLRNHSQNMKQSIKGESIIFDELYSDEIDKAINDDLENLDLENITTPIKSKFARFSPRPFVTNSPSFMMFGNPQTDD